MPGPCQVRANAVAATRPSREGWLGSPRKTRGPTPESDWLLISRRAHPGRGERIPLAKRGSAVNDLPIRRVPQRFSSVSEVGVHGVVLPH